MEQFLQEVINKYNRRDFEILSFLGRTKPIIIKCNCGHTFTLDRANRLLDKTRKNICPYCLIKKQPAQQALSKEYQHKYEYWYNKIGKNKYNVLEPYQYYTKPIKLECKKCGSITFRKIESLLKKDGCLSCELKCNTIKTDDFFKKQILEFISIGILLPNDKLPSVRSLATDIGVNPNTVSKAYQELENQGYIYSIKGKGCFIADNQTDQLIKDDKLDDFKGCVNEMKKHRITKDKLLEIIEKVYKEETV